MSAYEFTFTAKVKIDAYDQKRAYEVARNICLDNPMQFSGAPLFELLSHSVKLSRVKTPPNSKYYKIVGSDDGFVVGCCVEEEIDNDDDMDYIPITKKQYDKLRNEND